MSNPSLPPAWKEIETAARSLGMQPQLLDVRKPEDLGPAFDGAVRRRTDALVVGLGTLTQASQRLIVDLAANHRLPAVYASMEFAGGFVVYGVNYPDHYLRAATFADRIFKGTQPGDLPVERPTKFELTSTSRRPRPSAHDPAVAPAAGGSGDRVSRPRAQARRRLEEPGETPR